MWWAGQVAEYMDSWEHSHNSRWVQLRKYRSQLYCSVYVVPITVVIDRHGQMKRLLLSLLSCGRPHRCSHWSGRSLSGLVLVQAIAEEDCSWFMSPSISVGLLHTGNTLYVGHMHSGSPNVIMLLSTCMCLHELPAIYHHSYKYGVRIRSTREIK